jgi:hypothetical protein
MPDRRYRVLAVATHAVQYRKPIFRRMAKHPSLVAGLALDQPSVTQAQESRAIIWHKVPSIPGPHLLQFLAGLS